jgi:hypothetical protein
MNLNIMTVKAKVTTAVELITPISAGYGDGRRGWEGPACREPWLLVLLLAIRGSFAMLISVTVSPEFGNPDGH